MIGAGEVDGVVALPEAGLLAGLDPAVHRVRHHDHGDRRAEPHDGLELARREAEAAVAHDADHLGRRSEEHTSELQSLMRISYAVFCLKKKKKNNTTTNNTNYTTSDHIKP